MKPLSKDALIVAPRQNLIDTITAQSAQIETLQMRLQEVEFSLLWFQRQVFGTKSERFIPNDSQLSLDLGVVPVEQKVTHQPVAAHTRTKAQPVQGHGRGAMPTHLPFEDHIIEPQQDVTGWVRIGEEVTWEYDYEPKSLFVRRYIRPKYVYPKNDDAGVVIGALPVRTVEKGIMGPGLLADIVVDKYIYHMPLDRQRKKYEAEYKVTFAESVLCDAVRNAAFWIEPIYNVLVEDLLKATYLQADETSIKVLWHELKGKAHTGWYWGYNDPIGKIVVFDFQMTRGREGPNTFLEKFSGVLQTDDYAGYTDVRKRPDIIWAACMAHVRRKFSDCLTIDKERASYALECIKSWFALEAQPRADVLDHAARLAMRQEQIKPSMDQFHEWLKEQVRKGLPKNPITQAISYALNQWAGFTPFLTDGRIELSNNLDENNMRPIAVGRKNYMFKGSPDAAKRGAMIYSVLATAKNHGLEPWGYLRDVLTYVPRATSSQIRDFSPQCWATMKEKYLTKK
jgi:transposase